MVIIVRDFPGEPRSVFSPTSRLRAETGRGAFVVHRSSCGFLLKVGSGLAWIDQIAAPLKRFEANPSDHPLTGTRDAVAHRLAKAARSGSPALG